MLIYPLFVLYVVLSLIVGRFVQDLTGSETAGYWAGWGTFGAICLINTIAYVIICIVLKIRAVRKRQLRETAFNM